MGTELNLMFLLDPERRTKYQLQDTVRTLSDYEMNYYLNDDRIVILNYNYKNVVFVR